MKLQRVMSAEERRQFYRMPSRVYQGNIAHRATEESLTRMLVDGPTVFHTHARVAPYLLLDGDDVVGRCALIHDTKLPDCVQVAFFEAMPGLSGVVDCLTLEARVFEPTAQRLVVGMNGHLNYGAGLLLSHFATPPIFGLPYTPAYYADYFATLTLRGMVSYRFSMPEFEQWETQQPHGEIDGITVRTMDMRRLRQEVEQYTYIDNNSFDDTPYWSHRLPQENYELFHPFRFLLSGENLLFAERDNKPLGFLLWYPDFNELVGAGRDFTMWDVLRFRCADPIKTFRFAEIALLPQARHSRAVYAMMLKLIAITRRRGYTHGEGGFILEDNVPSLTMTRKYLERAFGEKPAPYRRFGIFEGGL